MSLCGLLGWCAGMGAQCAEALQAGLAGLLEVAHGRAGSAVAESDRMVKPMITAAMIVVGLWTVAHTVIGPAVATLTSLSAAVEGLTHAIR